MDTTSGIDIRFEGVRGIGFHNMRISRYLVETAFISGICTCVALFFLSGGFDDVTQRDLLWAIITWVFGAWLHLPVLLWLRDTKGLRCEYCQTRPVYAGKFCQVCDDRYGLSNAYNVAEKAIIGHIRERYERNHREGV